MNICKWHLENCAIALKLCPELQEWGRMRDRCEKRMLPLATGFFGTLIREILVHGECGEGPSHGLVNATHGDALRNDSGAEHVETIMN